MKTLTGVLGEMVSDHRRAIEAQVAVRRPISTAELLQVAEVPLSLVEQFFPEAEPDFQRGRLFTAHCPTATCWVRTGEYFIDDEPSMRCLTHKAYDCEGVFRLRASGLLTTETPAAAAARR